MGRFGKKQEKIKPDLPEHGSLKNRKKRLDLKTLGRKRIGFGAENPPHTAGQFHDSGR
jgi:hypothetical protein